MVSTMRLTRSQASSSRLKPNLQISPANETLKPNVTFKPNTNVPNTSDGKPSLFLPLAAAHFSELKSIWGADQRMPTVSSRRSWAAARQLDPLKIHSWFSRKRVAAKKVGLAIPDEMYDMPVGTPPSLEAKEENSLGPPSRKRIKIRGFEEHSGGSRTESPTLTLAGPIYDPVTPSGSSVTALSSPSPKLADTRRNRAYSQSFDVPTKIFLDPAPPEWVDSINKTTASLTAVTAKNKLDQSLLTHAASSLSVSDGVEGHAVVQGSKGDQGSTSAAVDCLCILCTSPVPELGLDDIDNLAQKRILTLSDLSLLYNAREGSSPVLSFHHPTPDRTEENSDSSHRPVTPSSVSTNNTQLQLPTPDPPLTELSAIPFLFRSPNPLLTGPHDGSDPIPTLDVCSLDGNDDIFYPPPFTRIHLRDDPYDFLPSLE